MIPYVKGFHLTAEMWQGNCDAEGWKLPQAPSFAVLDDDMELPLDERNEDEAAARHSLRKACGPEPPPWAPADGLTPLAPRLKEDLAALAALTEMNFPPLRVVRPTKVTQVFYGFGDTSGQGRGSTIRGFRTIQHPSGKLGPLTDLKYRVGVWGSDEENESSNYRELTNLVEDMEAEAREGDLRDTEVFMCTDNSTAESTFYKGSSSSLKLHALIVRLHKLSIEYSITIHLIHVAGTRMIAQGTDGCSRGILMEGVMAGENMLSYFDLDKSATLRSPALLTWIRM